MFRSAPSRGCREGCPSSPLEQANGPTQLACSTPKLSCFAQLLNEIRQIGPSIGKSWTRISSGSPWRGRSRPFSEVADEFLFLGSTEIAAWPSARGADLGVDGSEPGVEIWIAVAPRLLRLARRLNFRRLSIRARQGLTRRPWPDSDSKSNRPNSHLRELTRRHESRNFECVIDPAASQAGDGSADRKSQVRLRRKVGKVAGDGR